MNDEIDEFHGQGGAYVIDKDGKRRRVEEPTKDHPDGNMARDRHGKPLALPESERSKSTPAAAAAPAEGSKKAGAK